VDSLGIKRKDMEDVRKPLRILSLEDDPDDRQLMAATLEEDGLDCELVYAQTAPEFEAALGRETYDLIVSDFTLPAYGGLSALAAVKKIQPETPFILVSGTIGEERAVLMLKSGATDCVLKNHLARLGTAIRRALAEAEERTRRRRAEEALRDQAEQLRALAGRLETTREEERMRISREIHDELGETLTSQKLGLMWIRQRLAALKQPETLEPVFQKIDFLGSLADGTAGRVRRLCTELRPPILDDLGLPAAIEWQAREFQARTNIQCHIDPDDVVVDFKDERATALFRIFQEILTNVARHANATRVDVELRAEEGNLTLEVRDNGRGIAKEKKPGRVLSLGIVGMRERATMLGGQLAIHGKPGKGTTVTVSIPLQASQHDAQPLTL
jgi:signal transduction histidine kinase